MSVGYRLRRAAEAATRSRRFACLVLLAAAGLTIALPLLDHHAVEFSPWHGHIVIGALTNQERALALAHHHHLYEQPQQHDPVTGQPVLPSTRGAAGSSQPRVLVLTDRLGGLVSFYGVVDLGLFIAVALLAAAPAVSVWRPGMPAQLLQKSAHLALSIPPPRAGRPPA